MYICIHTHTGKKSRNLYQLHGYSRTRLEPQGPSPTPSPGAQSKITQARGAPKVTGHPYVYAFILLNTLDTNVSLFSYGYSAV